MCKFEDEIHDEMDDDSARMTMNGEIDNDDRNGGMKTPTRGSQGTRSKV